MRTSCNHGSTISSQVLGLAIRSWEGFKLILVRRRQRRVRSFYSLSPLALVPAAHCNLLLERKTDVLDSFQMVSLLKLAKVTEEGVRFLSPHDGSPMLLTPEHSISLQNSIGSDIIMQLDDVIATTSPDLARMREAMHRSVRWLDRCIAAHQKPETQNLFCIIQGGLDLDLRRECCKEMVARDTPGIAIGGLSGGEAKESYCRVVDTCTGLLPEHKPRYVMGIGYPADLMVSVALGADMFDCVWPTRTARFGNAIVPSGVLNLKHATHASSFVPIQDGCGCPSCTPREKGGLGVTRAFIHHLAGKETAGAHLLSMHNIWYLLDLMRRARQAILEDRFPGFLRDFFTRLYTDNGKGVERWAVDALKGVGVDLEDIAEPVATAIDTQVSNLE